MGAPRPGLEPVGYASGVGPGAELGCGAFFLRRRTISYLAKTNRCAKLGFTTPPFGDVDSCKGRASLVGRRSPDAAISVRIKGRHLLVILIRAPHRPSLSQAKGIFPDAGVPATRNESITVALSRLFPLPEPDRRGGAVY